MNDVSSPWLNLTPNEFEQFCHIIIGRNGFKNLKWCGGGGADKGRDIVCTRTERPFDGAEIQRRWLIQCKHYPKSKLSKGKIQEWLASCREHKPHDVLLIISRTLSANVRDWLDSVKSEYPFGIHYWEHLELRRQYFQHGDALRKMFPHLSKTRERVLIYNLEPSEHTIVCNEFSEVGFFTWNKANSKDAMRQVKEFIEFIKANDFTFDGLRG
jgi:hypothetical protein